MGPLGLTLPEEARVWWRWHDGIHAPTTTGQLFGPGFQLWPLAEAVGSYEVSREVAQQVADDLGKTIADTGWDPMRFPLVGSGSADITCACSGDPLAPAAVRVFSFEEALEKPGRPGARSLGEWIRWWLDALEQGVWRYDEKLGGWDYKRELLDRERRLSELV
jgi:hypothetical protein